MSICGTYFLTVGLGLRSTGIYVEGTVFLRVLRELAGGKGVSMVLLPSIPIWDGNSN